MNTGVFSVRYSKPDDPDYYAVDWGWKYENRWSCSEMECGSGHQWVNTGPLVGEPTVCHIGIGDKEGKVAIQIDEKGVAKALQGKVKKIVIPGVKPDAYKALLERFGLEDWRDEFSPKRIEIMSPASLAAVRREKEQRYNLPKKDIRNDTLGAHDFAEDYP